MNAPSERTLLEVLQEQFPDSSNTTLRKMLQSDRVRVNGKAERNARRPIFIGDVIETGAARSKPADPRVRVLFEDADIIVIDKAVGLLTVPPDAGPIEESAESLLNARAGAGRGELRIHHVHRLDFDTSGVLVFAKNTWTRDRLKELFAAHDVERIYTAIAHGTLLPPSGTLRSFLAEDRDLRMRSVPAGQGKEAVTHYVTIESGARFSKLDLTLDTGRRNQIRVHLSEAGHPVAGDAMYGRGRVDGISRLALHARLLGFVHPRTRKRVTFESALPHEMAAMHLS